MSLCRYLPIPSDRMGILWSLLSIEDGVILEYGPAGTTHFSMSLFGELGIDQENRLFTTHMSEDDVVMGDVTRLEEALVEVDRAYAPEVIFIVASSVSAVIGTDLRGVCAYMQEKVSAKLIALEQGGFRGDYSVGLREIYKLLAEEVVEPSAR
ncbi:MAG TPA: nitrogenase component 1, partial [Clostridia bacterium]|nr:nitrogenase component 1 [Clostridia bacterium]